MCDIMYTWFINCLNDMIEMIELKSTLPGKQFQTFITRSRKKAVS